MQNVPEKVGAADSVQRLQDPADGRQRARQRVSGGACQPGDDRLGRPHLRHARRRPRQEELLQAGRVPPQVPGLHARSVLGTSPSGQ